MIKEIDFLYRTNINNQKD